MATTQVSVNQFAGGISEFVNYSAHGVADYLYWMCGRFSLEAQNILSISNPGGQVLAPGGGPIAKLPIFLTPSDFQPDGITYLNSSLAAINIMIYINNYSGNWYDQSSGAFIHTASGIQITLPGFNIFAGTPPFSVIIQENQI